MVRRDYRAARFPFTFVPMMGDNLYGSESPQDYEKKFAVPFKALLDAVAPCVEFELAQALAPEECVLAIPDDHARVQSEAVKLPGFQLGRPLAHLAEDANPDPLLRAFLQQAVVMARLLQEMCARSAAGPG